MTPKKQQRAEDAILGRAMLVNVSVGVWDARKLDKEITEKANRRWANSEDAGRYHKRLFGGKIKTSHSALVTASHHARSTHFEHTLPWTDSGWRLLPTAEYYKYTEALRKVKAEFEKALEKFLIEYPELVKRAKQKLGEMFRAADYPTVEQLRRKFHFRIDFSPVPASGDFRLELPVKEMKAITQGVEDRMKRTVTAAVNDLWTRLGDAIVELRARLDDGKNLREAMVERISEVADALTRLNITNDVAVEKARQQALNDLASLDVQILKDDDKVRNDAAKKADAILAAMKGVYSPSTDVAEKAIEVFREIEK